MTVLTIESSKKSSSFIFRQKVFEAAGKIQAFDEKAAKVKSGWLKIRYINSLLSNVLNCMVLLFLMILHTYNNFIMAAAEYLSLRKLLIM